MDGMATAEDIRAARARLKESQAAFAARLGVNQCTVHRWESDGPPTRGTARLAIDNLLKSIQPQAAE